MPPSPRHPRPHPDDADEEQPAIQPSIPAIRTSLSSAPSLHTPPMSSAHVAPHIHEFGEVDDGAVVHLAHSDESEREEDVPVYGARVSLDPTARKPAVRRTHASKAMRRLFRKRTLMQYFYNDVLFRTKQGRRVSREELFLDLVLVGAIATLGHHLREQTVTWPNIEAFLLLFAVIYSAWRQIVLLWNYWGVKEDMVDKIGIYFTFMFLVGIALGAYAPFADRIRTFVGISAFLASFTPLLESFLWARQDSLLSIPSNRANTLSIGCVLSTFSLLPLLAAAFVRTERTTKILFWLSVALQMVVMALPTFIVRYVHRKNSMYSRPAISIEHAAEKFEVLTMIFMGETILALLAEGAPLVASDGAKSGRLYIAGFFCTAMLYSFQTLYIQVDNRILRRGKHALRHDARHGIAWASMHMLYHCSLVLVATGFGLALRDIAFPPDAYSGSGADAPHADADAHFVVSTLPHVARAAAVEKGVLHFTRNARWLFAVGWGATLICSALLSVAHVGGPRAATKEGRVVVRCVVAAALLVGMPFTNVDPLTFTGILAGVTGVFAIAEFTLVHLDRIGLFRSEPSPRMSMDPEAARYNTSSGDMDDAPLGPRARDERDADRDADACSSDSSSDAAGDDSREKSRELDTLDEAFRSMDAAPLQRRNATATLSADDPRQTESAPAPGDGDGDGGGDGDGDGDDVQVPDVVARALQRRLTRGNTSRLVAVQKSSDDWRKRRHALG